MTQRLYYENQYTKNFTATVVSCTEGKRGFEIILDKTAFFPEGGGQPGDTGFIGNSEVIDTVESGDDIIHICTKAVSGEVDCRLDFEKRFTNMQQHTGEHIFSGIIHSICGCDNVGFHMGEHSITVDFNCAVTQEQLDEAETLSNEAIYKNIPVEAVYPADDELCNYDYRSKKEIKGQVRLTRIEGVDLCACCGTHVAFTGEIGIIKVISMANYKSGVRITLQIGRKALADYREKNISVHEISALLKAKTEEITPAVERVLNQLQKSRYKYSLLKKEIFAVKANDTSGEKFIAFDDGGEAEDARIFSDMLAEKVGVAAVFSGNDENGYKYAITSRTTDVRNIGKELNAACSGRGGGKPDMVQGSVAAKREEIENFWNNINL
ncbi:MAG: alanyl-tRNA editing protein [Clostridia bacterium]|nr:alanyl-tRNA editing protein [Clostridia bacterium]